MNELLDEFALVTIKAIDFAAEHAWRVHLVELLLQRIADDGFAMAHQCEAALGVVKGLRRDSWPGAHGGMEALEPIGIARDGRPGIAKDNWKNVLLQFN